MKLILLIGLCLLPVALEATTYTAATCSQANVQTAINSETATPADGDIISIPSGTCTWSTGSGIAATFTKSVTVQGAGSVSSTTGGAATTGVDSTVIINNTSGPAMQFTTTAGKTFRATAFSVQENGSSTSQGTGNFVVGGQSSSVRVDHMHIVIFIGGSKGIGFTDCVLGVTDHVFIHTTQTVTNDFAFLNGGNCGGETDNAGAQNWAANDSFGSATFMYVEDSRLDTFGYASDCSNGGRFVFRYSTFLGVNGMANHGTHDGNPVPIRGCRAAEVYQVTWDDTLSGANGGAMEEGNSGPYLVWGVTTTKMRFIADASVIRQSNGTYAENIPPNGWGYCGNAQTGSTSVWDGNNTTNGYPCIDQPGRGKGDLLTTGATWPSIFDTSTSTQTWPNQALSPIYIWHNTYNDAGFSPEGCFNDNSGIVINNRDVYQQFATNCNAGSFNGTAGVGDGLLSARPGTCTAGPGGNTPGVGYWATDTNTLYVCNPTNTWTAYYTPYTYPHPLIGNTATAVSGTGFSSGAVLAGGATIK